MSELSRRNFVISLGASLGQMALYAEPQRKEGRAVTAHANLAGRRPNVVVMICDDIGWADLGCYGSNLRTPNLDRMAGEGVRLTCFDAGHPICSASRAALLTGRYATRSGAKPVYFPQDTDGLALDEQTLANLLHACDYRTMCVGKWHLGSAPQYLPTRRGFNSYFGVPYSVDMRPLPMIEGDRIIEEHTDRSMLTPRYTEAAVHFIESSSTQPFFLYMAFSYPHIPIDASPRFKGKSPNGVYGDAVEEIDWSVGQVLSTLEQNNLEENTLVIFTGDHGPWFQGSPGVHRGRKGTTYEGGFRVPFVAYWKGTLPAGHVSHEWTSNLDVLPTVASICAAKLPTKPIDGVDISAALAGGQIPERLDPILYFAGMRGGSDLQCARQGKWKMRLAQYTHETYVLGGPPGDNLLLERPELYDLEEDPGESYDVASLHPEIVTQMQQKVEDMIPTFPEKIVQAYARLKQSPASTTTPAGAASRPAKYAGGPYHFSG